MNPGVFISSAPSAAVVMTDGPDVSVILPVYRNRATLVTLHQRLTQVLLSGGADYELVFVDDGCPEASGELLAEMAASDPRLRVLTDERNRGQQRAVLSGIAAAGGRRIVIMDADLQDPPEAIPALLAKSEEGFDAVFAGRRGRYESIGRLLTSRLFKRVLHHACGVPADAGIFMVLSREGAGQLAALNETRPAIVAMVGCAGLKMASLPVERSERPAGASAYSSWERMRAGAGALLRVPIWKRRLRQAQAGNGGGGAS